MRARLRGVLGTALGSPERVLAALVVLEVFAFSVVGTRFASADNAAELLRACAPVGLLALALTPVIVTGGIDLSVGSLLGLCAVLFGMSWRDAGLPLPVAALLALTAGVIGGAINGFLVARLGIPPLIVTLGTFSLFRGLAEGLTGGIQNYTGFPAGFLTLGQGHLPGGIPVSFAVLAVIGVAYWFVMHKTTTGRSLVAIGYSAEGARYAGIPVSARLGLVYAVTGLMAAVAALVYVAYLGQAKADAGTGYELTAITAVVLGGTSIFGGRGTVHGTVLGLLALAILQNGLRLADLPAELAGVLTGVLLVGAASGTRLFLRKDTP